MLEFLNKEQLKEELLSIIHGQEFVCKIHGVDVTFVLSLKNIMEEYISVHIKGRPIINLSADMNTFYSLPVIKRTKAAMFWEVSYTTPHALKIQDKVEGVIFKKKVFKDFEKKINSVFKIPLPLFEEIFEEIKIELGYSEDYTLSELSG